MLGTSLLVGGIGTGTGLLIGGVFGARHAFEADHVAAVATLVEDERRPATTGVAWGVGHSLPILVVGALFIALDLQVSDTVATVFELLVALVLVVLGLRVLVGREALGIAVLRHVHGGSGRRSDSDHLHVSIGDRPMGFRHSHSDEESLAVGIVHGLAGSGGVVVALAAAAPTVAGGVAFLIGFSIASVVAMGAASWAWGRAIGRAGTLRTVAGGASVAIGLLVFAETIGFVPSV